MLTALVKWKKTDYTLILPFDLLYTHTMKRTHREMYTDIYIYIKRQLIFYIILNISRFSAIQSNQYLLNHLKIHFHIRIFKLFVLPIAEVERTPCDLSL